jgi:CRISPR-associated protein (TIGR03984 family)
MNHSLFQELSTATIDDKLNESLENWLKKQAITENYYLPYLLAHTEDGVIWGRFDIQTRSFEISKQLFPEYDFPNLRLSTLLQCHIFGEAGEVLLWKSNKKWCARLILQSKVSKLLQHQQIGVIPENQILWGTQGKTRDNFTLLSDGSQGLKHAVPISVEESYFDKDKKEYRPVRLELHHYFCYEKDGIARIFVSRLVSIKKEAENESKTPKKSY